MAPAPQMELSLGIEVPTFFRELGEELGPAMERGMDRAVLIVDRRAKENLTGRFLKVRTGRLRRSLQGRVTRDEETVRGVYGTNVFYGALHEAGVTHKWTIRPRRPGGLLRFVVGGRPVFARQVTHPGLRRRPWLSTAFRESRDEIILALYRALGEGIGLAKRRQTVERSGNAGRGGNA